MKRITDITNTKGIKLANVKVPFQVKLLQYNINNILYTYNNKYCFPQYITKLKEELINVIKESNLKDDKDAQELITKTRELYIALNDIPMANIPEITIAVDNTLKYLLYSFNKDKTTITLEEEIKLLKELKLIKEVIEQNNIQPSERIKNTYKLMEQLKQSILNKL